MSWQTDTTVDIKMSNTFLLENFITQFSDIISVCIIEHWKILLIMTAIRTMSQVGMARCMLNLWWQQALNQNNVKVKNNGKFVSLESLEEANLRCHQFCLNGCRSLPLNKLAGYLNTFASWAFVWYGGLLLKEPGRIPESSFVSLLTTIHDTSHGRALFERKGISIDGHTKQD